MKKIKVYYWSPFVDKVATTKAVLNSVLSLNKYSREKFEAIIINVFGEWLSYNLKDSQNIKFYDLIPGSNNISKILNDKKKISKNFLHNINKRKKIAYKIVNL